MGNKHSVIDYIWDKMARIGKIGEFREEKESFVRYLERLEQFLVPKDEDYKTITEALKNHNHPKPIVISERFKFHKRNQKEGEKVKDYVVTLTKLSMDCDFGAFLPEALRDRLVCGLRSETIQRKLLAEEKLTYEQAVQIA